MNHIMKYYKLLINLFGGSGFTFRKAEVTDVAQIKRLDDIVFPFENYTTDKIFDIVENSDDSYVALNGVIVIGYILVMDIDYQYDVQWNIYEQFAHDIKVELPYLRTIISFAVDPEFRSLGVGRELLKKVLSDNEPTILQVRQSNSNAIKLYESVGFKKYAVLDKYYRIDNGYEDGYLMYHKI